MRGRPESLFLPYTMNNKVIEFEQDRRIAWQPTALRGLVDAGVEGAIVGSALYCGAFTLPEALDVAGRP